MWTALFCAATTACASTGDKTSRVERKDGLEQLTGVVRLTDVEIRNLLVGRTLSHDVDRAIKEGSLAIATFYRESYRKDGTVTVTSHQAGMAGRYDIADNRLCLDLNQRRWCRRIFRSPDGGLRQIDDITSEQTPILVSASTYDAATPAGAGNTGQALRRLVGPELAATLKNTRMVRSHRAPNLSRLYEEFGENGNYKFYGDRVSAPGSYFVRDDEYCMKRFLVSEEICNSLFMDKDGRYYFSRTRPAVSALIQIDLISLAR
jgi:hypothetical protein